MDISCLPLGGLSESGQAAALTNSTSTTPATDCGQPEFAAILSGFVESITGSGSEAAESSLAKLLGAGSALFLDTEGAAKIPFDINKGLAGILAQLIGSASNIQTVSLDTLMPQVENALTSAEGDSARFTDIANQILGQLEKLLQNGDMERVQVAIKELPHSLKLKIEATAEDSSGMALSQTELVSIQQILTALLPSIEGQTITQQPGQVVAQVSVLQHTGQVAERLMTMSNVTDSSFVEGINPATQATAGGVEETPHQVKQQTAAPLVESTESIAGAADETGAPDAQSLDEAAATSLKPQGNVNNDTGKDAIALDEVKGEHDVLAKQILAGGKAEYEGEPQSDSNRPLLAQAETEAAPQQKSEATTYQQQSASTASLANQTADAVGKAYTASGTAVQEPRQPLYNNVMRQVVEQLDILISEGKSEAKIQLKPEFLGELKIHLIMENGSMKAFLDAGSVHAKQAIEANLQTLKQSLESQGLQISEFSVSVGEQHQRHGRSFEHGRSPFAMLDNAAFNVAAEAQGLKAMLVTEHNKAVNFLA